jgi:hypothetical protein
MKGLTQIPALRKVAKQIIWFEPPAISLRNVKRFLIYAMEYATTPELKVLRRYFSESEMRAALDAPLPGIMSERSWAYWNAMFGRYPPPPMPKRKIPSDVLQRLKRGRSGVGGGKRTSKASARRK